MINDITSIDSGKLKTLIEISVRMHSNYSDINALSAYILESAMSLVNCESSILFLINKENKTLRFAASIGTENDEAKNIPAEQDDIADWVFSNNKYLILNNVKADSRFFDKAQNQTAYVKKTILAIPMHAKGICVGIIELINKSESKYFDKIDLKIMECFSNLAGIACLNANVFRSAQDNISVLQNKISSGEKYHPFIAKSRSMLDIMRIIDDIAPLNTMILITGENGTGKEILAEQIHIKSSRRGKPFVRVNCANLSPESLESELFGCENNAFTNTEKKAGKFETAGEGTLFLDEIGELSPQIQSKLLRIIQDHVFERVGSNQTIKSGARIIAATNCNLEKKVNEGSFRKDLYNRLNVMPLKIPPLRERKDDIEPLAVFFLKKFSSETKKEFKGFSDKALDLLFNYYWPGNIRELKNCVERGCVLGTPPIIKAENLRITPPHTDSIDSSEYEITADEIFMNDENDRTLKAAVNKFKAAYIKRVLHETSWNQTAAGKILGIQRTYVCRLLNELHIR